MGNSHTLKADEHWEKWLQFYEKVASGSKSKEQESAMETLWLVQSKILQFVQQSWGHRVATMIEVGGSGHAQKNKVGRRNLVDPWLPGSYGSMWVGASEPEASDVLVLGSRTRG